GTLESATSRAGSGVAVVNSETLRATLAAFPTIEADQAAAVTDLTRSGGGVGLLAGRGGRGKTFVAGAVRHAYELDGYRLLGAAPTGLAASGLGAEGFGDVRTVDRLLADLEQRRGDPHGKHGPLGDEA